MNTCPRCGCEMDEMQSACPGCLSEPPLARPPGSAITEALKAAATLALTCGKVQLATELTTRARAHIAERDLLDWAETLLCNAECPQHCSPDVWRDILKRWRDAKHSISNKPMEIPDMTISTHKFWEVVWRHNGRPDGTYHPDNPVGVKDSMWYVSDPFADQDGAQKYADYRAGQDCDAEVWEVVKMKSKVGFGRELGDQGGN